MREPVSLAERLAWAEILAPGVVLLTDGAFLAAFRYRGPDALAMCGAERELLARHASDALLPFGPGWMLHVDRVRRPAVGYAPEGSFPDPATARIDALRRARYQAAGAHYETEAVLSATWRPPAERRSRWAAWFVSGGEARASMLASALAEYEAKLREMADRLSGALRVERLGTPEMLSHLYACLTGRRQPVREPPAGTDLADHLAAEMLGGFEPRVGALGVDDRAVLAVALSGLPAELEPGVLDALDRLPFGYRYSARWVPVSPEAAQRAIGLRRKLWSLKRRGLLGPDGYAARMVEDCEAAAAEASSGEVRFGHLTPLVVLMERSAATARAHAGEVLRVLRERGFVADVETVNAPEAFLGSLPGHGGYNVRRALVSTRGLAELLPLSAVWPGEARCPSPLFPAGSPALLWARTEGATPFRLNLHVGDLGHALVVGPPGAGKSTLLALLAAQWRRYPAARTAFFDVDGSAAPLARASGASYYALAAGAPDAVRLQPLARIDEPAEAAWALDWLEVLFALQGEPLLPARRERLVRALRLVAAQPRRYRTLSALLVQLQDAGLQTALGAYVVGGPLGHLLDAAESDVGEADHEVFELRALMGLGERALVPALLCLFRHVERRLDPARPTLMIVDEAWMALGNSLFAARIADWLLTWRKRNGAVVLATQSLAHLERLPARSVILETCPTRILLPNAEALQEGVAALYRGVGLSDAEVRLVAGARPKRDYYYRSPLGARLFDLGLSPEELAILTHTPGGSDATSIPALVAAG